MIDLSSSQVSGFSPQPSPHAEAIELLSKQLLVWYKQIGQFNVGDFSDRDARAKNLRKRCHAIEQSIKTLNGEIS